MSLEITKVGVSLVPIVNEKPMPPEQYEALDDATKADIETRRDALQQEINTFLRQVRDINKESRDQINDLNRRVGLYVVGNKIDSIREQHAELPAVISYLDDVQDYILSHLEDFTEDGQKQEANPAAKSASKRPPDPFLKYRVNIVVDNTGCPGRAGGHRDQSHLLQHVRPHGAAGSVRHAADRFHDDRGRLLHQGERRISRRQRP